MDFLLFSGRSNSPLGRKLAEALGLEQGRCLIEDFADGEIRVEVKQEVADAEVFVLQSTGTPAGQNLLELLLLADALRRRGARKITAVIPYFGYARQDRRGLDEEPIGARLMTDLLASRCDRIVAVDLHTAAIEGFSNAPLVHLSAVPLLAEAFREYRQANQVIVAPDAGAVKLAQRYGDLLRLPVAYLEKIRRSDREVAVQAVTGEVKNRLPILVDDMISTGGTMVAAIEALLDSGARPEISILTSHALLVGRAAAKMEKLPVQRIVTTDSTSPQEAGDLPMERYSLAQILADTLRSLTRH